MNSKLTELYTLLQSDQDSISGSRKKELELLASYVQESIDKFGFAKIVSICTHNSRRSQLMQILLQFVADVKGISSIHTYSGGTEGTAFNHRMVSALRSFGFDLLVATPDDNPVYKLFYQEEEAKEDYYFSKKYDNAYNPQKDFIAVMVCDEADADCPFVPGAFKRISLPYIDPKISDDTEQQEATYQAKILEIGKEMFFLVNCLS